MNTLCPKLVEIHSEMEKIQTWETLETRDGPHPAQVYMVDLEEMAVLSGRIKERYRRVKPFWQTTEEIQERLSADGQAFTEHQHRDQPPRLVTPATEVLGHYMSNLLGFQLRPNFVI